MIYQKSYRIRSLLFLQQSSRTDERYSWEILRFSLSVRFHTHNFVIIFMFHYMLPLFGFYERKKTSSNKLRLNDAATLQPCSAAVRSERRTSFFGNFVFNYELHRRLFVHFADIAKRDFLSLSSRSCAKRAQKEATKHERECWRVKLNFAMLLCRYVMELSSDVSKEIKSNFLFFFFPFRYFLAHCKALRVERWWEIILCET